MTSEIEMIEEHEPEEPADRPEDVADDLADRCPRPFGLGGGRLLFLGSVGGGLLGRPRAAEPIDAAEHEDRANEEEEEREQSGA